MREIELPSRLGWSKLLAEGMQVIDRCDIRHAAILERFRRLAQSGNGHRQRLPTICFVVWLKPPLDSQDRRPRNNTKGLELLHKGANKKIKGGIVS
jgi:hypothetical protein